VPIIIPYMLTGPQLIRAMRKGRVTIIIGVPRLVSRAGRRESKLAQRTRAGWPM